MLTLHCFDLSSICCGLVYRLVGVSYLQYMPIRSDVADFIFHSFHFILLRQSATTSSSNTHTHTVVKYIHYSSKIRTRWLLIIGYCTAKTVKNQICDQLYTVSGINFRLLSVNHALISPILTHLHLWMALLPSVPSTHTTLIITPHSSIPDFKSSSQASKREQERCGLSHLALWATFWKFVLLLYCTLLRIIIWVMVGHARTLVRNSLVINCGTRTLCQTSYLLKHITTVQFLRFTNVMFFTLCFGVRVP